MAILVGLALLYLFYPAVTASRQHVTPRHSVLRERVISYEGLSKEDLERLRMAVLLKLGMSCAIGIIRHC